MVNFALLKNKSIAEIIQVISLLALSVYLILPYAAVSIILGVFGLSSLFLSFKSKLNFPALFLQIGFYLVLMLSLVYSSNISAGFGASKGNVALLIIPFFLLVFQNSLFKDAYKYFLLLYIVANVVMIFILFQFFSNGIISDRFPNLIEEGVLAQLKYLWSYPFEFVLSKSLKGESSWFMNHKTILALNFLLASLLALKLFFVDFKSTLFKYFLLIPVIILVPIIIYTQALVNIALIPLLLLYTLIYLKGALSKFALVIVVIVACSFAYLKLDIKNAFSNGNTRSVVNLYQGLRSGEIDENADPRLFIYHCDMALIKEHFLFGYGLGDVQDQLDYCYSTNNFKAKVKEDRTFNSHNFYAHLLLAGGVLALLAFLALFFYNGKLAFQNRDYAFLLFLVIFFVNLLFDNIILRFQGALCFAFFNSLFLLRNLNHDRWKVV